MKKPSVADIANNCDQHLYWDRGSMSFFGQKRSDFRVYVVDGEDDVFMTSAPAFQGRGGKKLSFNSEAYWKWDQDDGLWRRVREE